MIKMKNRIGIICIILGVILLIAALLLVVHNNREDSEAGKRSEEMLTEVLDVIEQRRQKAVSGTSDNQNDPQTALSGIYAEDKQMPQVEINGHTYLGYISISELEGLELPILAEWSYDNLKSAPCRYSGSVYTDDMVLLGHNYTRHFGKLSRLESGSGITFIDMDGNVYNYEVMGVEMLSGNSVEEMISGEYDLSLFTCDYSGNNRFTVRCNRIK